MTGITSWSEGFLRLSLFATGVIHLLPAIGFAGKAQLKKLYGVDLEDPNIELLLRHRGLLFGLIGAALCAAAVFSVHLVLAAVVGLLSMIGFIALAPRQGLTAPIHRVIRIDWTLAMTLATALGWSLA